MPPTCLRARRAARGASNSTVCLRAADIPMRTARNTTMPHSVVARRRPFRGRGARGVQRYCVVSQTPLPACAARGSSIFSVSFHADDLPARMARGASYYEVLFRSNHLPTRGARGVECY